MFTKRSFFGVVLFSLSLFALASRASTIPFVGTGALITSRFFHTATLLPNGTVLVTGGSNGSTYLTSAEIYNPSNGTWTATGAMTDARGQHTATLLPNGKVLVVGGWGNSTRWLASAEIYDPSTGIWTTTGSMATVRVYHSATLLPNGKVLIAGGGNSAFVSSCEIYDPSTGTWTATGSMGTARGSSAVLLNTGKVLMVGGSTNGGYLKTCELYDPTTGTWTATGSMETARTTTATLLSDGKVLVAGGFYFNFGYTYISSCEIYDPSTGTWSTTGSMTTARESQAATLLPNGSVFEAGGGDGSNPLSSAEIFGPSNGTWTAIGSMGAARACCPTATLLSDGKVLVVGGCSNTSVISSTVLYGCAVTLDAAGKTTSPTTKTYYNGSDTYGTLPEPVCTNYTFGGWWTGTNGTGTQVASDTPLTSPLDHTLYAKWTALPTDGTVPSVTNVRVSQLSTDDLEIRYDLADSDSANLAIAVNISTNGGTAWFTPSSACLEGAVAPARVSPGTDRVIVWQGWRELPTQFHSQVMAKVIASESQEVAWYKMDESAVDRTLIDSSASAFNATNLWQSTADRSATGLVGKAQTFKTNECAVTLNSNACAACSSDNFTITFWGKRAVSNVHCEWFSLLPKYYDAVTNGGFMYCYYNKDYSHMLWYWLPASNPLQIYAATAFPADTWTHWAYVRAGTNFYLYKNSARVAEGHGTPRFSFDTITLGGIGDSYNNTRTLDDFRIFDSSLATNEIATLYNNGSGTEMSLADLRGASGVSEETTYDLNMSFTVTFDANGGAVDTPTKGVTYRLPYGELPEPTRTGYVFAGWQATTNGVPFNVDSNAVVSIASDHTLSATWVGADYTVTFDAQGGIADPANKVVTFAALYGELPVPTRAGYAFLGWWTGINASGTPVTDDTVVTASSNHVLYADYNKLPIAAKRAPVNNPAPVNEGASLAFSLSANDSTDTSAKRGMSNIVWYVDGVLKQETKKGAPNAVTSAFTLKTSANTVTGAEYADIEVKAVAQDRQGGAVESVWTVRVMNKKAAQTLAFGALPTKVLGDADFAPGATASSGLPVTYTSSNEAVAQIVNGLVHIVGAGTTVITASQPGTSDFKAATPLRQTLTVYARLSAEIRAAGGTVAGAGLYLPGTKVSLTAKPVTGYTFLRWDDGTQTITRTLVMPNANVTVAAWFKATADVTSPTITDPGPQQAMVGLYFSLPLTVTSDSLPSVTVSGLPSGLAYFPASASIIGVPKKAANNLQVVVTAKNANKTPATLTFALNVDPLAVWAQGAFNGFASAEALGSGSATLSVTDKGAASGKFTLRGTNFSFSANNYAGRDDDGAFTLVTTAKVGKVAWPMTMSVRTPEITDLSGLVPPTLSKAEGVLSDGGQLSLYRNIWKDAGAAVAATNFAGYYTATLPGGVEYGSGYLLFTVDSAGGVKAAGKLADGTSVSLSGTLILDEAGRFWTVLYAAPADYKGGSLFGIAEFFRTPDGGQVIVRPLNDAPFAWESLNPQATRAYGEGFVRAPCLSGGWYDTVGNLYAYYGGKMLMAGTDAAAPTPELLAGTNRYASAWWDPYGIELTTATNAAGVMTGLAAVQAGAPIADAGAYDYTTPTNTVGLTIGLTRSTGVFKGSFKAWFDYGTTHTSKTVSYEGALTPVSASSGSDGIAGRGFFLWADQATPAAPVKPYGFSWSYDFKILTLDLIP